MEDIFKELHLGKRRINRNWESFYCLKYTEDVVLITNNLTQLQEILRNSDIKFEELGLITDM